MQLAYVFWHWPAPGVDAGDYEERMRTFHAALGLPGSRTFRLDRAPWDGAPAGPYEDWYPVDGWEGLGALNERAVSGRRRAPHAADAVRVADGAGGVYRLVHGVPDAAVDAAAWFAKPEGAAYDDVLRALREAVPDAAIWQRQMVLGPAPEFAVLGAAPFRLPWPTTATAPRSI